MDGLDSYSSLGNWYNGTGIYQKYSKTYAGEVYHVHKSAQGCSHCILQSFKILSMFLFCSAPSSQALVLDDRRNLAAL